MSVYLLQIFQKFEKIQTEMQNLILSHQHLQTQFQNKKQLFFDYNGKQAIQQVNKNKQEESNSSELPLNNENIHNAKDSLTNTCQKDQSEPSDKTKECINKQNKTGGFHPLVVQGTQLIVKNNAEKNSEEPEYQQISEEHEGEKQQLGNQNNNNTNSENNSVGSLNPFFSNNGTFLQNLCEYQQMMIQNLQNDPLQILQLETSDVTKNKKQKQQKNAQVQELNKEQAYKIQEHQKKYNQTVVKDEEGKTLYYQCPFCLKQFTGSKQSLGGHIAKAHKGAPSQATFRQQRKSMRDEISKNDMILHENDHYNNGEIGINSVIQMNNTLHNNESSSSKGFQQINRKRIYSEMLPEQTNEFNNSINDETITKMRKISSHQPF